MGQKLIVPVAFVVLALGAAIAIYFMLQSETPASRAGSSENSAPSNQPEEGPEPLSIADFEISRLEPDPVRNEKPPQTYTAPKQSTRIIVSGRLIDEFGTPVSDARVQFIGSGRLQGMKGAGYSNPNGEYRMLAWAAVISANGDPIGKVAAESQDGRVAVGSQVNLSMEPAIEMPDLAFTAVCSVEGQVIGQDGEPAAGAEVTVHSAGPVQVSTLEGREPVSAMRPLARTITADQSGRFVFRNLSPALYRLSAQAGYFGVNSTMPEVDLSSRGTAWQDIQLEKKDYVRGVLTDQSGNPVPGVIVRIAPKTSDSTGSTPPTNNADHIRPMRDLRDTVDRFRGDGPSVPGVRHSIAGVTDSAGRFGFSGLTDVPYTLEAKLGEAEARLPDVKINQADYTMQVATSLSFAGVVNDAETGAAIEFFDSRLAGLASETAATPFDRVSLEGLFEYHPAGNFLFLNPSPDATAVRICAPGYMPAIVDIGEIREGGGRADLNVSLKPLCEVTVDLTLEGRRLDFEPVAMLFEDRLAYEASSDQLGHVRIPRVAPSKYRVKVTLADGTQLECELEVPAKRQATLEAKLKPAG